MDGPFNCSNYQEVSDVVSATNISYTQLFLQCPNACALVVGNGNPDIAGIGVNRFLPRSLERPNTDSGDPYP